MKEQMSPADKAKNSREKQTNPGYAKRISQNPWFQIMLSVIAIVSIGMTIFIYLTSQEKRELVYAINPVYTTIASAQKASALDITYQDVKLGNVDITATQVAIWNKGKQSIKPDNVLKPIVIYTNPPVRILEASISKYSRDVIGFDIDSTQQLQDTGRIPVSWRILERDDGASIQLIYVGSSEIDIYVEGVIEGQNEIKPIDVGIKIRSPSEQIESSRINYWIFWVILVIGIVFFIMGILLLIYDITRKQVKAREQVINLGLPILMIVLAIVGFPKAIWPPFGF